MGVVIVFTVNTQNCFLSKHFSVYLNKILLSNLHHFRDHPEATQQMNDLIIAKVSAALKGHWANPDLVCKDISY